MARLKKKMMCGTSRVENAIVMMAVVLVIAQFVVKTVASRFDPKQHPDDGEIEKENDVRHLASGKCDCDDGGGAGYRPVGRKNGSVALRSKATPRRWRD